MTAQADASDDPELRVRIIDEIRRLANDSGGQPPGSRAFARETGIRDAAWRGIYWPRWNEAVIEAGLTPNERAKKYDQDEFLTQLAKAFRSFGKVPSAMEMRMYRRSHPEFPYSSIWRHYGSTATMHRQLAEWTKDKPDYSDVAALLGPHVPEVDKSRTRAKEGLCISFSGA